MARFNIVRACAGVLSCLAVMASATAAPADTEVFAALEPRSNGTWSNGTWHSPAGFHPPKGAKPVPFHLEAYVSGQRYHPSKASFISFAGGDGTVTSAWAKAAEFYIYGDQLLVGNKFVHLDFSNGYAVFELETKPGQASWKYTHGEDGWLHIQGEDFTYGDNSEAVFCLSDDGFLFVQGQNKPSFTCRDIGLAPKQKPGSKPKATAPHVNTHPQTPTAATSVVATTYDVTSWADWSATTAAPSAPAAVTTWSDDDGGSSSTAWEEWSSAEATSPATPAAATETHHPGHPFKPSRPSEPTTAEPVSSAAPTWGDWESTASATTSPTTTTPPPAPTKPGHKGHPHKPTTIVTTTKGHPSWPSHTPSTTTTSAGADPSSDVDWTEWEKRSPVEFDVDDMAVE